MMRVAFVSGRLDGGGDRAGVHRLRPRHGRHGGHGNGRPARADVCAAAAARQLRQQLSRRRRRLPGKPLRPALLRKLLCVRRLVPLCSWSDCALTGGSCLSASGVACPPLAVPASLHLSGSYLTGDLCLCGASFSSLGDGMWE
jgi:hypothetical protein